LERKEQKSYILDEISNSLINIKNEIEE
jgi:hypothetical protein